jgi:hypothetical protein
MREKKSRTAKWILMKFGTGKFKENLSLCNLDYNRIEMRVFYMKIYVCVSAYIWGVNLFNIYRNKSFVEATVQVLLNTFFSRKS